MNNLTLIITILLLIACSQKDMKESKKAAIENYISSYNNFDVEGMLKDLHAGIVFENVSNGTVDMKLEGKEAFRRQAEAATSYFRERTQSITSWDFQEDSVSIQIEYIGILNIELPNGMKPGDTLELRGKSTFIFKENQIVRIIDES